MIKPGNADFTIAKANSSDLMFSFITYDQIEKIKRIEGVKEVIPYVISVAKLSSNPFFIVGGLETKDLKSAGVDIIEGKAFANDDEIMLGKITAKNLKLNVGDTLAINEKNYKIAGIYQSGLSFQDSGAIAKLSESQKMQKISDKVTMTPVVIKDGYNAKDVAKKIENSDSDLVAIIDSADFEKVDQGTKIIDSASLGISVLAVLIGGIGVMNTIIMSVFERTREIGVLRAVGWRRSRVVKMILGESLVIGIVAAIFGTIVGTAIIYLVAQTELGQAWLKIGFQSAVFAQAFITSMLVVLVGSIYPAYKASKLLPTEALRYE